LNDGIDIDEQLCGCNCAFINGEYSHLCDLFHAKLEDKGWDAIVGWDRYKRCKKCLEVSEND